jgi:hypothetical protein
MTEMMGGRSMEEHTMKSPGKKGEGQEAGSMIKEDVTDRSHYPQGNKGVATMDMIMTGFFQEGSMLKTTDIDHLGMVEDTMVGLTRDMKVRLVATHRGKGKQCHKMNKRAPTLLLQLFDPQKRNKPRGIRLLQEQTNLIFSPLRSQLLVKPLLFQSALVHQSRTRPLRLRLY